jgi:hypothetical protein
METAKKDNTIANALRAVIGKEVLLQTSDNLRRDQKVYFIVDTHHKDLDFLEDYFMAQIQTQLGDPFIVDFAEIGSGTTMVQDLITMVFLKSPFLEVLDDRLKKEEKKGIFVHLKNTKVSSIIQRFLECKGLNDSQKKKLGVNFDLSENKKAVEFFEECINSYIVHFNRKPVFYFRNPKLEKESLGAYATLKFLKKVQENGFCHIILKASKNSEYLLLRLEEFCTVLRITTIDCETLSDRILRMAKSPMLRNRLKFSEEGLREFCRAMSRIHHKTISSSALSKALLDIEGQAMLKDSTQISAKDVSELFSIQTVKITPPKPLRPRLSLAPYFANEVERLTKQCRVFGLDPHYSLPWSFRLVLRYISYGSLRYNEKNDTFELLRFLQRKYWGELDSALRSMGYRYSGGAKWVFEPRK